MLLTPKKTAGPPGSRRTSITVESAQEAPWKAQRPEPLLPLPSPTLGRLTAFLSRLCSPLSKPPAGSLAALLPTSQNQRKVECAHPPEVVTNLVHKAISFKCLYSEVRRFCPALISP